MRTPRSLERPRTIIWPLFTDAMLLYDPASGAYAFSYIGYNGTMAGGGDTENSRWDDALKYRVAYGPVHFGAASPRFWRWRSIQSRNRCCGRVSMTPNCNWPAI